MSDKNIKELGKAFVSFKDENGKLIEGIFDNVKIVEDYLYIESSKNSNWIPREKVNKIKKQLR